MPGDNTQFKVKLIQPVAMEEGLRFAIREGGRTVVQAWLPRFWINQNLGGTRNQESASSTRRPKRTELTTNSRFPITDN